ncbi:hypothetical protein [Streptomyces sp. NPDC059016]|uniref:hypothetical protein n=1 Tax=Streptomyces sp. NPDC059016 TaxID=3346699 RepID=UPI00369301CA
MSAYDDIHRIAVSGKMTEAELLFLLDTFRDEVRAEVPRDAADELLPVWEAVYEPGNVSDYLIGYANSEAAAKGAAIAWLQSESDKDPARLEWVSEPAGDRHDVWFDLIENHDDGIHTGIGITVRRRLASSSPSPAAGDKQPETEDVLAAKADQFDHLHRTTLPQLRREIQHHQDSKKRWRSRAEKAEARVAELEQDSAKLAALEAAGVDNWEGYSDALEGGAR